MTWLIENKSNRSFKFRKQMLVSVSWCTCLLGLCVALCTFQVAECLIYVFGYIKWRFCMEVYIFLCYFIINCLVIPHLNCYISVFSGYWLIPSLVQGASDQLRKTKAVCIWHAHLRVNSNFAGKLACSS